MENLADSARRAGSAGRIGSYSRSSLSEYDEKKRAQPEPSSGCQTVQITGQREVYAGCLEKNILDITTDIFLRRNKKYQ